MTISESIDPQFQFLEKLDNIKHHLKHLNLEYNEMLPIQYHNFQSLNLTSLNLRITQFHQKTFDFDLLNHLAKGTSLTLTQTTPSPSFAKLTFKPCCITYHFKPKWTSTSFTTSLCTLTIPQSDPLLSLTVCNNYIYLQRPHQISFTALSPCSLPSALSATEDFTISHSLACDHLLAFPCSALDSFYLNLTLHPLSYSLCDFTSSSLSECARVSATSLAVFRTCEESLDIYSELRDALHEKTRFDVEVEDRVIDEKAAVEVLRGFAGRKVRRVVMKKSRTREMVFEEEEVDQIVGVLKTEIWSQSLQVLEMCVQEKKFLARVLRALTRFENLKELELKWLKDEDKDKVCKKIIKRKQFMFDRLDRFIFEQIQE